MLGVVLFIFMTLQMDFVLFQMRGATVNRLNGSGINKTQAANRARRHMLSWMDTPDDLLFVATDDIKYLNDIFVE